MKKDDFIKAAECLRTIAHPDRLAIIHYLLQQEKAAVGDIAKYCQIQGHVASEHLSLMKDRGFLQSTREGRYVFYSVKERALEGIMQCIKLKFSG